MRVVWTRRASRDRDAIWNFIADTAPAYAERVELRLESRVASLALIPKQGRVVDESGRRRLSVPDVRYVIDYRIDEDAIRILHIFSTSQDRER